MTEKEKELIMSYIIHTEYRLDDEIRELQQRIRFRKIGTEDVIELLLTQQRKDDFTEFALTVLRLLNLEGR